MTTGEFIVCVIWKFVISFTLYKNILFRILPHQDIYESLYFLIMLYLAALLFFLMVLKNWKNEWTAVASVVLPPGVYTLITYAKTTPVLVRTIMIISAFLSIGYTILILARKVKYRHRKNLVRIYKNRISRCVYSVSCIAAVAMLLVMVGIGWKTYFGMALISSSVESEAFSQKYKNQDTIEENQEMVLKLIPSTWQKLSTHEKIDVLQTVCNIEAHYLGINDFITVQGDNLSSSTLGDYIDRSRLIRINLDHIENAPAERVLSTLLHEMHHAYEYRLVEVYNSIDSEYRNLRLFRDTTYYAKEVDHYIDPRKNYHGYMSQRLELDSETYAKLGVQEYYERIDKWLEEHGQKEGN